LIPRHYVIRKRIVVRNSAIQLRALVIGERKTLGVGADGRPYLFDERKPFIDV
jgi:hypothetical protein